MTDTRASTAEPLPEEPPHGADVRPEDGAQDVSQEPGSIDRSGDAGPSGEDAERSGDGVAHVTGTRISAEDVLKIARSQLGTGEDPPGSNHNKFTAWYGVDGPWCDMFVSWCAERAGAKTIIGRFAYTPSHAQWFRDHGRWGGTPRKGAIVFFDLNGNGGIDHVGIVEAVRADGAIVTIEGNTSDHVMRRVRRSAIAGYGYPAYAASAPERPASAPPWPGRHLRYVPGRPLMRGDDVRRWQSRMAERGWRVEADGEYGPQAATVCRSFQKEKGLTSDGIVGPATWKAAWTAPTT